MAETRTDCDLSLCTDTLPVFNLASQLQGPSERREKKVDLYVGDYIPDPFSSTARHTQERGTRRQKQYGLTYTPPRCQSVSVDVISDPA